MDMGKKAFYKTSVGSVQIEYSEETVTGIKLTDETPDEGGRTELTDRVYRELEEFLSGERKEFTVPFTVEGTAFEKAVLEEISRIPYGETVSYGELAERAGYPGAARAAGTVCGKNRLPFIIPCHRVIKGDGSYGEYGLGKDLKIRLLEMEKAEGEKER